MRESRSAKAFGLVWLTLCMWPCHALLLDTYVSCPDTKLQRAAAAIPQHTPAVFASLATRGRTPSRSAGVSTMPTIDATGGPGGLGTLKFDRSKRQYLDGGGLTLDVSTGFTLMALVSFAPLDYTQANLQDLLFSFRSADSSASFLFYRNRNNDNLYVGLQESIYENDCVLDITEAIANDVWHWIVVQLDTSGEFPTLTMQLGGVTDSVSCTGQLSYQTYVYMDVGGSPSEGSYTHGSIAALYVTDRFIDASAVASMKRNIINGYDILELCGQAPCPAGTAGPLGVGPCVSCVSGKYQSATGSGVCIDCPAESFSEAVGATTGGVCVSCRSFSSSVAGQGSACPCLAGYGDYEVEGARACVKCSDDTWTNGGYGACSGCLLRANNCDLCAETVLVTVLDDSGCSEDGPGTYTKNVEQYNGFNSYSVIGGVCHIYRRGTYWFIGYAVGATSFFGRNRVESATLPEQGWEFKCPYLTLGRLTVVRTVTETAACFPVCMNGETWHVGDARCVQCASSYYKDWRGTAPCERCPSGLDTGGLIGSTSLTACVCPAGSAFIPGGTQCQCNAGFTGDGASCVACPAGTYKAAAGGLACDDCAAGTFLATPGGAGPCGDCAQGSYSLARASNCTLCDANANTAASQSTSAAACSCNLGYTGDGRECTSCVAGKYKDV